MKVVIDVRDARRALALLSRIAPAKPAIPIIASVKASVLDGDLVLEATNLEVWATTRIPIGAEDDDLGVCISAETLRHFAVTAPDGSELSIESEDASVTLRAGRSRARIGALPSEDWPRPPASLTTEIEPREIDGAHLSEALMGAMPATAAKASSREYLVGVWMDRGHVVAMDGARLHAYALPGEWQTCGISREHVKLIADLLSEGGRFGVGEFGWSAEKGMTRVVGRGIDSKFPDWQKIQSTVKSGVTACFERDEMLKALQVLEVGSTVSRIASLEADTVSSVIRLAYDDRNGGIVADTEVLAHIECGFRFGVTISFLRDALQAMPKGSVSACIPEDMEGGPMMLEPADGSAFLGRRAFLMGARV